MDRTSVLHNGLHIVESNHWSSRNLLYNITSINIIRAKQHFPQHGYIFWATRVGMPVRSPLLKSRNKQVVMN